MRGRPHRGWGHRPRHRPRGRSLTRRIFAWLVATVVVAVLAAGAVSSALAALDVGAWGAGRGRWERFVGGRFEAVWADPAARSELAGAIYEELQVPVTLEGADGAVLVQQGAACHNKGWRIPVGPASSPRGWVVLCGTPRGALWQAWPVLVALLAVIAALGLGSIWVARRLGRPLGRLAHLAEELGQGRWERRAEGVECEGGEIGTLGAALNTMAARIERQIRDQRTLLAAVSHELRTPLGHLRLLVELAREEEGVEAGLLVEMERELVEMDELVDQLLASSRLDFELREVEALALEEIAAEALGRLGVSAPLRGAGWTRGDRALLRRALTNLLHNAQRHGGGLVAVVIEAEAGDAWIWAEDRGEGLSEEELARLSAPFAQAAGEARAQGLGLGLFLAQRIAAAHGGAVVTRRGAVGAAVGLRLPAGAGEG